MSGLNKRGLSQAEREKLIQRLAARPKPAAPAAAAVRAPKPVPAADDLSDLEFQKQIELMRSAGAMLGIDDPYLRPHDGRAGAHTMLDGREHLNFSSYDYLGLNGDPRVGAAAKAAIDRYGTSVSASRLVAGERPLHRELEQKLAEIHGAEDCVTFVSGHATNVTLVGHMLGKDDLILHDALIHNSVMQGARLSGAMRLSFPHNDLDAIKRLLGAHRSKHGRALIVIEGCYSMDGDTPDVAAFSALARRHGAWLMVDEAHSLGVLGTRGLGVAEHFGLAGGDVDFWMGTLSKTLAGCGGYIAGKKALVEYLKLSAPGFVYSVGMSPPVAAASLEALNIMLAEPQRVAALRANAVHFLNGAKAAGFDTGLSEGFAIVPIITGSSIAAARMAQALLDRGVNVQPILYPAVPERSARLRFFLSAAHTREDIDAAIAALIESRDAVAAQSVDLTGLAAQLNGAGGLTVVRPGRIDIDGYNLALEEGTGVATYARNLSIALQEMGSPCDVLYGHSISAGTDSLMQEIHFFDPVPPARRAASNYPGAAWRLLKSLGGIRAFEAPITGRVIAEDFRARLPRYRRILNADSLFTTANDHFDLTGRRLTVTVPDPPAIMHWTYPVPVKVRGALNIYTLHDLVPLRLPHTTLDKKGRYLSLMRLLARKADHLVTVSETSRRDIIELLGVAGDRVTNTYQAAEIPAHLLEEPGPEIGKAIEEAFGLAPRDYFVFFGAVEPKKNIARLIEGFLAAQTTGKLIIVGKKAWKWKKELAVADLLSQGQNPRVLHLDYMPYSLLISLIRGAKAMVFPSLYEGFGLPVLEALLVGIPVLTSNTGALPEVVGDAALTVDPYDVDAIAAGIRRLDQDAGLRANLAKRGKAQAAKFSHAAYRERLAALYARLGVSL